MESRGISNSSSQPECRWEPTIRSLPEIQSLRLTATGDRYRSRARASSTKRHWSSQATEWSYPKATVSHFDCGAVTYGLVLAAWDRGLGTVINGQGIMQSAVVREFANIPEDQVIMTCVAMGWPDDEFVANDVKSHRRPVDEVATFIGFDD